MAFPRVKLALILGSNFETNFIANEWCKEKNNTFFSQSVKYIPISKAIYKQMLLIVILICFVSVKASKDTSVGMTYSRDSSYLNFFNNRIRDYTAKVFKAATVNNATKKNAADILQSNILLTSFTFKADEIFLNLIKRDSVFQNHIINNLPPNSNFTKILLIYSKKKGNKTDIGASSEDYSYDDYVSSVVNKNVSNPTESLICSSCQQHEKAKKESLESIKKHILMRLQLSHPPNIKFPPPAVPQKILDYFYKNFNYSRSTGRQPSFKHSSKRYKKDKGNDSTPISVEEKMRNKENTYTYFDKNHDENDDDEVLDRDDIMISDNTFFNDNSHNSMQQFDEFYSRLHSIYVFPTSKFY